MNEFCGEMCKDICCSCCRSSRENTSEERMKETVEVGRGEIQTFNCCLICCCCCFEQSIFDNYSSKTLESISSLLLIFNIGLTIYLFVEIGLSYISLYTIILLFLIIIMLGICLIFIFFFYYWRKSGKIQTSKKGIATTMSKIAIFLTLLCLVSSGISEYLVLNDTQNEKCKSIEKRDPAEINSNAYLRRKYDKCKEFNDTNSKAAFSTFSFMEVFCIANFILFFAIKKRIALGIDFIGQNKNPNSMPNEFQVYNPGIINSGYPQTHALPYQPENGIPPNAVIIVQPQQLYTYQQNANVFQNPNNQNEKINDITRSKIKNNSKKVIKKTKNNIGNNQTMDNNQNGNQTNMMSSQRNIKEQLV